jgi:hypothetical protein
VKMGHPSLWLIEISLPEDTSLHVAGGGPTLLELEEAHGS